MPESGPQGQPDEAMIDLLIKQAVEGLSAAEQRELDGLDGAVASGYLRGFEKAAAAITLAGSLKGGPVPVDLQQRLEQQAGQFFAAQPRRTAPDNVVPLTVRASAQSAIGVASRPRGGVAGWFAAAACLLLAVFFWSRTPQAPATLPVAVVIPPSLPMTPAEPVAPVAQTAAQLRDALLARADSIKVILGATKDAAAIGVSGDVVWDPVTQTGYLHFVGLAANDPRVRQYQAWIFDKDRDARYPVDAGVFDVSADSSDIIIPIHAAVSVRTAAAFAVTLEKAGGAVVSAREHLLVLGKVS